MNAKPYPKYRPSGVEWLGDVPEHWEVTRIKFAATINDDVLTETTLPDYEFDYVEIGGVEASEGITAREKVIFEEAPSRARRRVQAGDTIISTVRTYLRAIAPIHEPCKNLVVSTGFAVVRPRKVNSAYASYALRESSFIESVVSRSVGVSYPAVNASAIGNLNIPIPTSHEQQAIADFLDERTGKLDGLLGKKRELIGKLKEKRSALISRTVTKGLPPEAAAKAGLTPNPKLKPSGIPWLGDIPEHWEVLPLKYTATIVTGYAFSSDDFEPDGVPLIRIGDITRSGAVTLDRAKCLPYDYAEKHKAYLIENGDIVMAMTGATIGKVGQYFFKSPALLNQRVCIFRPQERQNLQFLWFILNSKFYVEHVLLKAFGGAQPNISETQLLECICPRPPAAEQKAISVFLDTETSNLDRMIQKVENAIEKLTEYRTALITAAVTGKIDVRRETR